MRTLPWHHHFDSPYMGGMGVVAEGDIGPGGGIEIGLFYLQQVFSIAQENNVVVERGKRVYITMGYREWFTPKISGALAFFSNYSMSDAEVLRNDFAPNASPATSAQTMTKYGFDFSVQFEPWRTKRFSAVFDGRYSWSVTSKPGEDENFYAFIIGLKYFLQARESEPK
jgi:hypothetical protein